MKIRLISFFTACLLCAALLLPIGGAFADSAESIVLRVGIYPFAGFQDEDGRGGYSGYNIDYLTEIGKIAGWTYEYVTYDNWDACYEGILNDEVDIIGGTVSSDYRAREVVFSQFPMASSYLCLYVLNSNDTYAYNDYAHFKNMSIALVMGEPRNGRLQNQMNAKGCVFSPKYYPTQQQAIEAVHNGEADAFLGDRLYYVQDEHSVADFGLVDLYFMLNKKVQWLPTKFNSAMEQLLIENPNFNRTLFDKYYGSQNTTSPVFTPEEKAYLAAHSTIPVWYDENWAPISYTREGESVGIAPDILRRIGQICGVTFTFHPMGDLTALKESAQYDRDQLLCTIAEDAALLEDQQLTASNSYLDLPLLLVGRQGAKYSAEQSGSVAVLRGNLNLRYYIAGNAPQLTPETFATVDECFSAVTGGRCDFTMQPSYVVNDYLQRQTSQVLGAVSTSYNFSPLCIGLLPAHSPELLSILNKGIAAVSASERDNIILENTISSPYKVTLFDLLQKNAWVVSCVVALVLGSMLGYIAWSSRKLSRIAYRDPLTGSYSYAGFARKATEHLSHRGEWALVTLDIDGFKLINNTLGREEGDKLLIGLTQALEKGLSKEELLCRSSSDNFILLLHYTTAEDLRGRMKAFDENLILRQTSGVPFRKPILACGVCTTDSGDRDLYTMVGNANMARKSAKRMHHSSGVFYNKEMHLRILQEREIESAMLPALRSHEFVVYLQPKYSLESRKIVGAEALVRWQHPSKGLLMPGVFIPLAERNGFVTEIDFYVYREVFGALRHWIDGGHTPVPVSVNVSRAHLQDADFTKKLCALADEFSIPRELVECELTENLFFENLEPLTSFIKSLKDAGFWVSIDDFGSGYSSLNMLKEVPVDTLKLDREFFCRIDSSGRGRIIIASIIHMAKELKMQVISEGVETQAQAELLSSLDCDMAQGFLFSKPIPKEAFEQALLIQERAAQRVNV
ncbi:MAG: EAL domain-containing protein [Oscillospiraceae bacterium]|nr:EAL domain-containing protein [Oscillospiraceae bacterium]